MPFVFWELDGAMSISVLTETSDVPHQLATAELTLLAALHPHASDDDWIAMAETVDRRHPVTRIIAFTDRHMYRAAKIAARLDLEYHGPPVVTVVQNKTRMRARLAEAGVEDVPFAAVHDAAGIEKFGSDHGWPVVVKPVRGTASIGVTRVDGPEEVDAAFAKVIRPHRLTGGGAFVEQFLAGVLYSAETFSERGRHRVIALTVPFVRHPDMVIMGLALPATPPPGELDAIHRHVSATLDALGVADGATFTELIVTADGPRVCEVHLRMAGDETWSLIRRALGLDLPHLWARQILGERVMPELEARIPAAYAAGRASAIWFLGTGDAGVLRRVEGLERAGDMPGVFGAEVRVEPGRPVPALVGNQDRLGHVRAAGPDLETAVARAREAAGAIRFVIDAAPLSGGEAR